MEKPSRSGTIILLSTDQKSSILHQHLINSHLPISYTPHGHYNHGDNSRSRLGFNGERLEEHGVYQLGQGYRQYNPTLGRFYTQDVKSPYSSGGINSYAYCIGDPINNVDPTGASPLTIFRRRLVVRDDKLFNISNGVEQPYKKIPKIKEVLAQAVEDTQWKLEKAQRKLGQTVNQHALLKKAAESAQRHADESVGTDRGAITMRKELSNAAMHALSELKHYEKNYINPLETDNLNKKIQSMQDDLSWAQDIRARL